jgi:hypothetical protein
MRFPLLVFAAVLGLGLVTQVGRAEAKQKIAILGVEADDGSDYTADQTANLARWITQGLRARAGKLSARFDVPANANKDLAEMKLVSDCLDEKLECMVQMGKDLGVERVIYGKLSKNKSGWTLTLHHLNVSAKSFDGRPYERVIVTGEATEEGVKKIASVAFGELTGATITGSIQLSANVEGATIFVDGAARGSVSGGSVSLGDLSEGPHTVALEAPGHRRWEQTVSVRGGEPTVVVAQLESDAVGGPPGDDGQPDVGPEDDGVERPGGTYRVLFWTSLVTTGVGVAGFTVTGLKVRDYEDEKISAILIDDSFSASAGEDACKKADEPGSGAPQQLHDACDGGKKYATYTNVLIGVSAVAAAATAFFYYKGYIASDNGRATANDRSAKAKGGKKSRKRVPAPSGIVVTPQVYGTSGAGLGATITF